MSGASAIGGVGSELGLAGPPLETATPSRPGRATGSDVVPAAVILPAGGIRPQPRGPGTDPSPDAATTAPRLATVA